MTLTNALLVALGAAVGAPLRYLVNQGIRARFGGTPAAGTLVVNVVGSFVLGVVVGAGLGTAPVALVGIGFCGALTTFSLANDLAKYFAILPALFSAQLPHLEQLNVMHLHSPQSAIVSAVVFNALIIVALIPLALKGVSYTPASASSLLRRNLGIWGLGGVLTPFIGIWLIDQVVALLPGLQ